MDMFLFKKMLSLQLITEQQFNNIRQEDHKPVSVHWDLRTLLYLGILLLTTALGILVYKNIDTLGHNVIIVFIGVLCAVCFAYCFKNSKGFFYQKIQSPNIWFDYILLMGCLLLLTFIGYIQFQYNVFGNRWGMAAFISMVILFITAYYFDHIGVLSLAITNLATWIGITVTPLQILKQNDFNDVYIIYAGLVLGAVLAATSFVIKYKKFKPHFAFTYLNFGVHILFVSLIAAMFYFESAYLLCFLILAGISFLLFKIAVKEKSFYFLVITYLYLYIAFSHVVIKMLSIEGLGMGSVYLGIIYFIISGIALIKFFIYYNKILKKDASL